MTPGILPSAPPGPYRFAVRSKSLQAILSNHVGDSHPPLRLRKTFLTFAAFLTE